MAKKAAKKQAKKTGTAVAVHSQRGAVAKAEPDQFVAMIERVARDPSADISKLERLLAMRDAERDDRRRQEYNEAMRLAQAEMPNAIGRDEKGERGRYARLETIAMKIKPVYTRHGLSLSFGSKESPIEGHYRVTCDVRHSGGHVEHHSADLKLDNVGPEGKPNKTNVQGWGSMISYARRYITVMIFNITIANEDDDGTAAGDITGARAIEGPKNLSADQLKTIQALIADSNAVPARVLEVATELAGHTIEYLQDIPAKVAPTIIKRLQEYKAKAKKK